MTGQATRTTRPGRPARPARPASPVEIELKYRPESVAAGERYLALDEIGGLAAARARTRTQHLDDRYVDTADGALARAGYAARLRVTASSTVISVKATNRRSTGRGPFRREELEGPADRTSAPRDWPASAARSLILELGGDAPLEELVTVRQVRRKRELRAPDSVLEVSLDEVEIVLRSEVIDRFVELEVELVRGDEAGLASVGRVLDADPALKSSRESKLEAALSAVREHATKPQGPAPLVVGKSPGVLATDPVAEAGRKVLRFHFARMLAREAGTRDGRDPGDLHAMRVATRRMRAAWRVFGDGFRPARTKSHRARLRETAARLGAVRDLDVLIAGAEEWQAELPNAESGGLDPLLAAWRGYRDDARVLLIHHLDSDAHAEFIESFRVFVQTEGAGARPFEATAPHRVRDTAPSRAWAAYEHVRAYEPVLRWADVETLHELRIAAKWLRYTLEFVRETLEPDVELLVPRVVALQDHLGLMHDADVAASMARTFLVEHGGDLSAASAAVVDRYLDSREREVARLRKTVGIPWRGIAGVTFRRRLGRALAGL
ncbi:MAG: CHAD domain-containing protein [Chloroflexota bacterium]